MNHRLFCKLLACTIGTFTLATTLTTFPSVRVNAAELTIGQGGTEDDYVCWGRVKAEVSFTPSETLPNKIIVRSGPVMGAPNSGAVAFSANKDTSISPLKSLEVDVDTNTRTARFYVQGTRASEAWKDGDEINGKDVVISVELPDGTDIDAKPVMVRVRKNAENLTEDERDIFLEAFKRAAIRNNQFAKFWGLHQDAGSMIAHQMAFLPWHRVLLAHLEREIQAEIPEATLPYWEFDKPAKKVFSEHFMGRVGGGANLQEVQFSAQNPLSQVQFADPRIGLLTRVNNGDVTVDPAHDRARVVGQKTHALMNAEIWYYYHGAAHNFVGGLISQIGPSPADPLFFLLHANVDRAWAVWQRLHDKFDRNDPDAYWLQGAHTAGANYESGNYVDDTMWPWDHVTRSSLPSQPTTIGLIDMPPKVGAGTGIGKKPEVGDLLDYMDLMGDGDTHNYCYDMVPAGTGNVQDFP